jgi:hypothetical protein
LVDDSCLGAEPVERAYALHVRAGGVAMTTATAIYEPESGAEPVETVAALAVACIEKGDQAYDKAEEFYKAAGLHIAECKRRKPDDMTWPEFCKQCLKVGRSRADELIMIGDGRKTLDGLRKENSEKQKLSRSNRRDITAATKAPPIETWRAKILERCTEDKPYWLDDIVRIAGIRKEDVEAALKGWSWCHKKWSGGHAKYTFERLPTEEEAEQERLDGLLTAYQESESDPAITETAAVEPPSTVAPGADGLDIPLVLRRATALLPDEPTKPVGDAEASARRRKAEYAVQEAIEGEYLDELADAIARAIAARRAEGDEERVAA